MKVLTLLLIVLSFSFSHIAQASTCPLAMIVFVGGGIASSDDSNVKVIRDSFEETFGPSYPITLVESSFELQSFDFALALTVDHPNRYLTVNVRDILLGEVISTESLSYRNETSVDAALEKLAKKIKRNILDEGLVGSCQP